MELDVISIILGIYFIYCQENMFFYKTEKFFCRMSKGNCENCKCWSCKRLEEIKRSEENVWTTFLGYCDSIGNGIASLFDAYIDIGLAKVNTFLQQIRGVKKWYIVAMISRRDITILLKLATIISCGLEKALFSLA